MRDGVTAPAQELLLGRAAVTAGAGVLVSDDTARFVAANSAACKLLGYTRDQLLQLRLSDLADRASGLVESAREVAGGKIRHGTASVRRKDGRTFPAQWVSVPAELEGLPHVLTLLW
ncbi:MAG TPA: PAS domain-containing protein [Gaiellaceae bacterium]|nr:PAS domain-containing protein [Gaiellaceae bacterium]